MVRQGAGEEGIARMCQNATDRTAQGVSWYQARYLCMLAAAYAQARQAERGLRVVVEAKDLVARNEEHMWEGELARIEGELLRVQGASPPAIEACFARAIAITHAQGAKSLELRAALSGRSMDVSNGPPGKQAVGMMLHLWTQAGAQILSVTDGSR